MQSALGECEKADYYISFCSDLFSSQYYLFDVKEIKQTQKERNDKKNKKVKVNEAEKVKNGGMRSAVGEYEEADYYISFCSDLFSHIVPYRRIFRPRLCNVTSDIWIKGMFRLQKFGFTLPWG